ncbi:MAG: MBL fold metallo-hydrolase [Armatimonadetes bacterium]|nr:MBL fold metallo-hydrolase [Armatimonadota bacterium]
MFTERFFVEGLAHASYLFGAEGEAAVVDPKRDVDDYLAAAERHSARIVAIFETHPHADFASGHLELAQRTGAPIYISEQAPATYAHQDLRHGQIICVGSLSVTALATPGHSPDSMSFYVEDGEQRLVFTGDILFVGNVGRPDLRDADADPRAMAEALDDTLRYVLFRLPDETIVYPAHGAGSLCGRQIGAAPQTTIGAEKKSNWVGRFPTRDEFVAAMLSNLPDRPAYFSHDVQINLAGARPLAEIPRPEPLAPSALRREFAEALVLDTRTPAAYGAGHLSGSLNVGVAVPVFSTWVGFFVSPEIPVVLVVERSEDAEKAWLELARIGCENAVGYVLADSAAWRAAELEVRETPQLDVEDVEAWLRSGKPLLDVRTPGEWHAGRADGAQWIPLPTLPARLAEVPPGPLAVMCGTGYRSSLATSLLARAGRTDVANVAGGWSAWMSRRCPELDALNPCCRDVAGKEGGGEITK